MPTLRLEVMALEMKTSIKKDYVTFILMAALIGVK